MNAPDSGSYQIRIEISESARIRIGALGHHSFPAGTYVYTGSAMRNLEARVARHLRKDGKKLRWHIDYLLSDPRARVTAVLRFPSEQREECSRNLRLLAEGAGIPVARFGSSDCRCPSHLVRISGAETARR